MTVEEIHQVIQKHCQQNQILPTQLLTFLFFDLAAWHYMHAQGSAFDQGAANRSTVYQEIADLIQNSGDVPVSIIATVEKLLASQHFMHSHNAENARKHGDIRGDAEALERRAESEKVLLLIIRELINEVDRQGIQARLALEERQRKGREQNPPQGS